MARLNIEDSLWGDHRFQDFLIKIGNRHIAKGMVIEMWALAQKFWLTSRGMGIPRPAWESAGLSEELVTCGLAKDNGEFVYAMGSSEQFAWLEKRSENGRENKGKSNDQRRSKPIKGDQARTSYSYSLSSSVSKTNTEESIGSADALPPADLGLSLVVSQANQVQAKKQAALDDAKLKARQFCAEYIKAYQTKFTGRPSDLSDGKTQGQILNFVKAYPIDRACELIQAYFQIDEKWFNTKGYDFQTFRNNLNRIGQALDSGKDLNDKSVDWQKVFGRSA